MKTQCNMYYMKTVSTTEWRCCAGSREDVSLFSHNEPGKKLKMHRLTDSEIL